MRVSMCKDELKVIFKHETALFGIYLLINIYSDSSAAGSVFETGNCSLIWTKLLLVIGLLSIATAASKSYNACVNWFCLNLATPRLL